jgi:hypothetical protein
MSYLAREHLKVEVFVPSSSADNYHHWLARGFIRFSSDFRRASG